MIKVSVIFDQPHVRLPYDILEKIDFRRSDDGLYYQVQIGKTKYPAHLSYGHYQIAVLVVAELDDVLLHLSEYDQVNWQSYEDSLIAYAELGRRKARQLSEEEKLALRAPRSSLLEEIGVWNTTVESDFVAWCMKLQKLLEDDDEERQRRDFYARPRWEECVEILRSVKPDEFGQSQYNTVARLAEKAGLI